MASRSLEIVILLVARGREERKELSYPYLSKISPPQVTSAPVSGDLSMSRYKVRTRN
jgi:hypothetical protein